MPFTPFHFGPSLGLVGADLMYDACAAAFLPALALWGFVILRERKK